VVGALAFPLYRPKHIDFVVYPLKLQGYKELKIIKMKKVIFSIFFTISSIFLFAHNKRDTTNIRPINTINLNIFGEASIFSINYERLFIINSGLFLTGQLGIGYNEEYLLFGGSSPEKFLIISHHMTGNLGKRRHFLEFGMSGAIITGNTNKHYLLGPIVGYRLQPLESNKVNLRIFGNIPVIGFDTNITYYPFGLSLGICF
jgi:hypothetical protein